MSWNSLGGNQAISGNNLQDAVNNGVFSLKQGQGIPNNTKCLTRDQVYAIIDIEPINGNKLAVKSDLISKPSFFYIQGVYNSIPPEPVDCGNGWDTRYMTGISFMIVNVAGTPVSSHPDYLFETTVVPVNVSNGQYENGYNTLAYECGFGFDPPFLVSAPIPEYHPR